MPVLLLLIPLAVSILAGVWAFERQQLPALGSLLPFWALLGWSVLWGRRYLSGRQAGVVLFISLALGLGAIFGPLQSDPALNRITHGAMAGVVTFVAHQYLLRVLGPGVSQGLRLMLACALATTLGVMMELAEALIQLNAGWPGNHRDTMLDLASNLAGMALVSIILWIFGSTQRKQQEQT